MAYDARLLSGVGVMVAVVEAGNFARAAEILGLTASGVSRAVARLEARIGVKLFHRNPRTVVLTDDGRRCHDEVAPLLASIGEAAEQAAGASATVRGRLKVSADPWFARVVLAPRLPELTRRYPQLSVEAYPPRRCKHSEPQIFQECRRARFLLSGVLGRGLPASSSLNLVRGEKRSFLQRAPLEAFPGPERE
jgi:DNA-binding transcriptional LysR family regulator